MFEEKYPSWCEENEASATIENIYQCFKVMGQLFRFQHDNVENMFDHFMTQLDSRSSRMGCPLALLSLHADYIGGENANYRKWYFASQIHTELKFKKGTKKPKSPKNSSWVYNYNLKDEDIGSFTEAEWVWKDKMHNSSDWDYIFQIGLYLLIWGESNNIRFMPECICFIYHLAKDYLDCSRLQPIELSEYNQYDFLETIINPLYCYVRDQQYKWHKNRYIKRERDHNKVVGYDDINLFFWYSENLKSIKLSTGDLLYDLPREHRFGRINLIVWDKCFSKTFRESRSWSHILVDFSRVWIIHLCMFWYFACPNSPTLYTPQYNQLLDNPPADQVFWTFWALGGALACLIATVAAICERLHINDKPKILKNWYYRLLMLTILLLINTAPSVYILGFIKWDVVSHHGTILGIVQFCISISSFVYLALVPPQMYFRFRRINSDDTQYTSNFPKLTLSSSIGSYVFWLLVFLSKFIESYFFLILSIRDPIRVLSSMDMSRCKGDNTLGTLTCKYQPFVVLGLLYFINMILFFLDTYLWYVIINLFTSVGLAFLSGVTSIVPWRNVYLKLPERIVSKLIFYSSETKINPTKIVTIIWNNIIVSLFREHLLSIEQVNNLIYEEVGTASEESEERKYLKPPAFFVIQEDNSFSLGDYFTPGKQAERRISFFAQSLAGHTPDPYKTLSMPTFTVLIPHYFESIILGVKKLIKEDRNSKIALMEYLKALNIEDWENYLIDCKFSLIQDQEFLPDSVLLPKSSGKEEPTRLIKEKLDDIPLNLFGFNSSSNESILRARIWASLRSQTLYRTISGFMNYEDAIKTLYKVENLDADVEMILQGEIEDNLEFFVQRKFRMLIAMQKFQYFNEEELEDVDFLFFNYPNIKIACLEKIGDEPAAEYYSSLICSPREGVDERYHVEYRIKLSGNPILGDGKSDNQNNALIYYRGEYIQVVDANQDNYIEECFKIKAVLAEFEEINLNYGNSYIPGIETLNHQPVAIVGAREYIFSKSIGILGDVAAGKEKTFGTLFARTLSQIGGKLHYGHPDFLNAIFMTTRGGISKAQKGLHLNEDIFAGMLAACRGGKIKHCDFYQCGKGRDLGFDTIQNFTTKIGAGMGEQILSREYFYLGMNLPIDRFLSFFYAHLGFHLNNLFIMLAVQLFMIFLVNLGSLKYETIACVHDPKDLITDIMRPLGCYNIQTVLTWVNRFILSVFVCFFLSFIPIIAQELIENGLVRCLVRVLSHISSLAPLFEVFICQLYSKSLRENITFGGAKYISSGRGFAIQRLPFYELYTNYARISIYTGASQLLVLIFATISMWRFSLLWFWITIVALCLSPFIFNPHQFDWRRFFLDYKEYLHWLFRRSGLNEIAITAIRKSEKEIEDANTHSTDAEQYENTQDTVINQKPDQGHIRRRNARSTNSWINYAHSNRVRFTGMKKHKAKNEMILKPSKLNVFIDQMLLPAVSSLLYLTSYLFINSQTGVKSPLPVEILLRILILSLSPFLLNIVILILTWPLTITFGAIFWDTFSEYIASTAYVLSLITYIVTLELIFVLENWNYARAICALLFIISFQKLFIQTLYLTLSRELEEGLANLAWWSGRWGGRGLGKLKFTQPLREFIVKVCELLQFAQDFLLGQTLLLILSIPLLVPCIDRIHTIMLFWTKVNRPFYSPLLSQKDRVEKAKTISKFMVVFLVINLILVTLVIAPIITAMFVPNLRDVVPRVLKVLIQPVNQLNNDTGDENAPNHILRGKPQPITMKTIF